MTAPGGDPRADLIRALFAYGTALVVVVGGLLFLWATHDHPDSPLHLVVAGFIGAALQFLWGSQIAARSH